MAQQTINNGESGLIVRGKLNSNFTELYGFSPPAFVKYTVGNWITLSEGVIAAGAATGLNTIRLTPMLLLRAVTISDLGVRIGSLFAGGNVQLAIYNSRSGSPLPGTLAGSTGSITTAVVAEVSADITGADITLQPGLYWGAVNSDNATSACMGVGSTSLQGYGNVAGSPTLLNVLGTNGQAQGLTFAQTFGTWPDLTAQTLLVSGAVSPLLAVKISAIP